MWKKASLKGYEGGCLRCKEFKALLKLWNLFLTDKKISKTCTFTEWTDFCSVVRKFYEAHENLIVSNASHYEPVFIMAFVLLLVFFNEKVSETK